MNHRTIFSLSTFSAALTFSFVVSGCGSNVHQISRVDALDIQTEPASSPPNQTTQEKTDAAQQILPNHPATLAKPISISDVDIKGQSETILRQMRDQSTQYRIDRIERELLPELDRLQQQLERDVLLMSHSQYVARQRVIGHVRGLVKTELRDLRRTVGASSPQSNSFVVQP